MYKVRRLSKPARAYYIAEAFVVNHRGALVVVAIVALIILSAHNAHLYI